MVDEYFNYQNCWFREFRPFAELVERRQILYDYVAYARLQAALNKAISPGAPIRGQNSHLAALGAPTGKCPLQKTPVGPNNQ